MKGLQGVSDLINETVKTDWTKIKCVTSKEWEDEFDEYLNKLIENKKSPKSPKVGPKSKSVKRVNVDGLDESVQFKLCYDLFNLMEGIWLEGRKHMNSIEQLKLVKPLELDELVDYAFRLRSTTYSPPENMNVDDPTRHYDLFPQYHFLGVPNTSQMHMSRLFSLSKMENQCSPPTITFEVVSDTMKQMKLSCSTPNSVIHFQTSRESNIPCPRTGIYLTHSTDPAVYDDTKSYKFKIDCNPFTVHAWATCEGLKQSPVVNTKYESNLKPEAQEKRDEFGLMLSRKK
ncbi:hypothetical protein MACK_002768 [Theileria orientalis]|uniref:Uncharacterized protein n=1 Tax=Theileria orientalis TaxID=68886 RepID=A0A976MDV8_THEOR|nr:hypothetical protein MACK_002768 [Theileria orientalis]